MVCNEREVERKQPWLYYTKNYLQCLKLTKLVCLTNFTCVILKINGWKVGSLNYYGLGSFAHWM